MVISALLAARQSALAVPFAQAPVLCNDNFEIKIHYLGREVNAPFKPGTS